MAGVSVKMGVTGVNEFKKGFKDAQASVSALNEALKLNEAQLKLTGDKEAYTTSKVNILRLAVDKQTAAVKAANDALQSMQKNGVDKNSAAYQNMQKKVYSAATELKDLQVQLKEAEGGTSDMNAELKKIGDGVSWENVTSGIGKITDSMEKAAKSAINLGKKIVGAARGASGWADEMLTGAAKNQVDVETYQRMRNLADIIDTDADAIIAARRKLMTGIGKGTKGTMSTLNMLGIEYGGDAEKTFWEAGEAIMQMTDEAEQNAAAQNLFGRSWSELIPLFTAGEEEYKKQLEEQTVLSEEQVKALGAVDDAFKKIDQEIERMKNEFWSQNADKIVELMQWLIDNKEAVVTAVVAIGGAFGALKIVEFAANLQKTIEGFQKLGLLGGAKAAGSAAGSASGGGWLSGLFSKAGAGITSFFSSTAATPFGVTAAALLPAVLANNSAYNKSNATMSRRLGTASASNSPEALFLASAAEALNIGWGKNQDFTAVQNLLMGMNPGNGLATAKMYNALNGATTSQGNYTWNELQRLWSGEEMDISRQVAILESVTDAYEQLVASQNSENEKNKITAEDLSAFQSVPDQMAAAVAEGVSGIEVTLDGQKVGNLVAPYVSSMLGNMISRFFVGR